MRSTWVRSAALAVLPGLMACAVTAYAGGAGQGPLRVGGNHVMVCLPAGPGPDLTWGFDAVRNTGTRPVEVTDVALVHPTGLRMVAAYFVPVHLNLVGPSTRWPPPRWMRRGDGVDWAGRVRAVGPRKLAPMPSPDRTWNLVLHLRRDPTQARAGFRAVRISYVAGSYATAATTTTELRVRGRCG